MPRTIALTGWGQAADALSCISPHALHLPYTQHADWEKAMLSLCDVAEPGCTLIGWSMGGHMAVHALARGWIKPQRLVLIGVPYQFVKDAAYSHAMSQDTFDQFCNNYASNPERTLKKACALVAYQDTNAAQVEALMANANERMKATDWLYWLKALGHSSCMKISMEHFPDTIIVHGLQDAVVNAKQAQSFQQAIPRATLSLWEGCGHAPHWHDPARLQHLIEEFTHV